MATLKVNLTKVGNPCEQDETTGRWNLMLCNCEGIFQDAETNKTATIFNHAGHSYGYIPINYGYAEVKDVPPGRYFVFAMEDIYYGGWQIFHSNYISHVAVVDVCCGCDDYCVTLYNPHLHECFTVIFFLFDLLKTTGKLDDKAIDLMNNLKGTIEKLTGRVEDKNIGLTSLFANLTKESKTKNRGKKKSAK